MEIIKKYWMLALLALLVVVTVFQQFMLFKMVERLDIITTVLDNQGEYIIGIVQTPEVNRTLQELSNR